MYNELRRNTEGYVDPTAAATLNKQEPGDIWTYMDHDCLILQNHGEFSTILMMGDKQRDHSSVEIETTAGTRYTDPRRLTWGYHSRMYRYRETLSREDFEKVVNAIADVMDITVQAAEEDQEPQIEQPGQDDLRKQISFLREQLDLMTKLHEKAVDRVNKVTFAKLKVENQLELLQNMIGGVLARFQLDTDEG